MSPRFKYMLLYMLFQYVFSRCVIDVDPDVPDNVATKWSTAVSGGCSLHLMAGHHTTNTVFSRTFNGGGNWDDPIEIYGDGCDTTDLETSSGSNFFTLDGSYFRLRDIELSGGNAGILAGGTMHDAEFLNFKIHGTTNHAFRGVNSYNLLISNAEIYDLSSGDDCITANAGFHDNIIEYLYCHDVRFGINFVDPGAYNNIIRNNVIINTLDSAIIIPDSSNLGDNIVKNNIILEASIGISPYEDGAVVIFAGIQVFNNIIHSPNRVALLGHYNSGKMKSGEYPRNIRVSGNTIISRGPSINSLSCFEGREWNTNANTMVFENNLILCGDDTTYLTTETAILFAPGLNPKTDLTFDNNAFYGYGDDIADYSATNIELSDITTNIQNYDGYNFYPKSGAEFLDRGTTSAILNDIDDVLRDNPCDIGVYEYNLGKTQPVLFITPSNGLNVFRDLCPQSPNNDPSQSPTNIPTYNPSDVPTDSPTDIPSNVPSNIPSNIPSTSIPTHIPTSNPLTSTPTTSVPSTDTPTTLIPTINPATNTPTTSQPTPYNPTTNIPTNIPSEVPSNVPSNIPTDIPTNVPSNSPTEPNGSTPTTSPSNIPSQVPSAILTGSTTTLSAETSTTKTPNETPTTKNPNETSDPTIISTTKSDADGQVGETTKSDGGPAGNRDSLEESGDSDIMMYIIIGAAVAVCLCIAFMILFMYKRKQKQSKDKDNISAKVMKLRSITVESNDAPLQVAATVPIMYNNNINDDDIEMADFANTLMVADGEDDTNENVVPTSPLSMVSANSDQDIVDDINDDTPMITSGGNQTAKGPVSPNINADGFIIEDDDNNNVQYEGDYYYEEYEYDDEQDNDVMKDINKTVDMPTPMGDEFIIDDDGNDNMVTKGGDLHEYDGT